MMVVEKVEPAHLVLAAKHKNVQHAGWERLPEPAASQGTIIRLPAACGTTTADSFSGNCAKKKSMKPRDFGRPDVRA